MSYSKKIEVTWTGMVVAKVLASDGRTVGLEFLTGWFNSNAAVERRTKKAHKWADDRIALCERQEFGFPVDATVTKA